MKDGILIILFSFRVYFSYKTTQRKNKINKQFLLKVFLIISILLNIKNSEIHLIIQGSGKQTLINQYFQSPSEVLVNGFKDDSCSKTCNLQGDKNNITLRFNDNITSCSSMFSGIKNSTEIDLSNFDFSKVESLSFMFNGCTNLEKIEFGNTNTSSVRSMCSMFQSCFKLKSINFSKFDTSKVINMGFMLSQCSSLEKIEFGNINTSSVKDMRCMFQSCYKLTSIDLSNFDTSKVTDMERMFFYCNNLKYLDLSNFDTSNVNTIDSMFYECSSLIFLNLKSFKLNNTVKKTSAFLGISSYVTYCIEDQETKDYLNIISNCSHDCFKDNIIIDFENNKCTKTCSKYQYKNIYDKECPNNTYPLFYYDINCENNVGECIDNKPENYYLDMDSKTYKKCYETCKSCYAQSDEKNNNCIECKHNYTYLNYLKSLNCYEKCDYYHYFDENKYNKLIIDRNKCIDDCKKDDKYKYNFDNKCYKECPENSFILIDDNQNICYNITPEGIILMR